MTVARIPNGAASAPHRRRAAPWAMALLAVASGCAAFLGRPTRVGDDRIRITHTTHAGAKVQCITCHEQVYDAETLGPKVRPPESKCMECHQEKKDKGDCGMCHTDVRFAADYPTREQHLKMSHAKHIERVNEDCVRCHQDLPERGRPRSVTVTMPACLSCHEHEEDYAEGRCGKCHNDLSRYPLQPVIAFTHQGDFLHTHGTAARAAGQSCAQCHDQTFCSACHAKTNAMRIELKEPERVERNFIHRNDWLSRHNLEAAADPVSCQRCHGTSFCESCHTAQDLTPRSANPRSPHPAGWSFPGAANTHGETARRDISRCASCHDQGNQSICVNCHRVGGVGGNPHPPAWQRQHPADEIHRNGMCLACHL